MRSDYQSSDLRRAIQRTEALPAPVGEHQSLVRPELQKGLLRLSRPMSQTPGTRLDPGTVPDVVRAT